MAQRIFAPANDPSAAAPGPEPAPDPAARDERRRAAAYIDLWERHLSYVAAHGAPSPSAGRKPGG